MTYRIQGLEPGQFARFFASDEASLARSLTHRVIVGEEGRYPCRVSLRDADPGDELVLTHFTNHAVDTPYRNALREERARDALSGGDSVTGAIYEAGYGSASRFYENTKGRLGMTASAWANGGAGATIRWAVVDTTMGPMLVAATDKGVCRLSFGEDESELRRRFPKADLVEGGAAFGKLLADVVASVEAPGDFAHIPLDVKGTAFQEACWEALRAIPPGETRTYAEIAAAAGNPKAVRAAGSANARNNVAVLIPCHRVVRKGGDLGGYAYGQDIKRELLERETK